MRSYFIGHDELVAEVLDQAPASDFFQPLNTVPRWARVYAGDRVSWVGSPGKMVKIPAENILFMEGNTWNLRHAAAILEAMRARGRDLLLEPPAGRVYRITAERVKQTEKYARAGELEYQLGMTRPWDKSARGGYYAQLLDGNHRALAAIAAGEKFVWVYVGENYVANVLKKDLNGAGGMGPRGDRASKRTMLVFFFAPDCDDCAGLKPEVERFARENPSVDVRAVNIYEKELGEIDPPGVPSFLCRYPDNRMKTLMPQPVTAAQLANWIAAGGGAKDLK